MWVRGRTTDAAAARDVFLNDDYPILHIPDVDVIVDAGANAGFASLLFHRAHPHARIFALEPDRSNFAQLQRNAEKIDAIQPIHAALWDRRGEIGFHEDADYQVGSRGSDRDDADLVKVPATSIPEVMKEHGLDRIDLLKVDIEGAERVVFAAADGWIDRVRAIFIELHDRKEPGCGDTFFAALRRQRWRFYIRGENVIAIRLEEVGTAPGMIQAPRPAAPRRTRPIRSEASRADSARRPFRPGR